MKLLQISLLLSLLSLAFVPQSSAYNWDKFLNCSRQGAKAAASLLREAIPALRTLLICVDYTPPSNYRGSFLSRMKVTYEILRLSAFEKSNCLIDPLMGAANILKPYVQQVDSLKCLDE
ncbi:accessory gland protein Acp53Ea [Drosophila bipectinata]|uniref:accessory gland protein Acp53Ea n=1 Tax=Drosophila bipectinata TaxID=42026 RepID=UPI001C8A61E6|nr:accessory gland protein Acp53Ea [Drosophila bipectinata]